MQIIEWELCVTSHLRWKTRRQLVERTETWRDDLQLQLRMLPKSNTRVALLAAGKNVLGANINTHVVSKVGKSAMHIHLYDNQPLIWLLYLLIGWDGWSLLKRELGKGGRDPHSEIHLHYLMQSCELIVSFFYVLLFSSSKHHRLAIVWWIWW